MPYIPPSVMQEVKRMDLLTYLKNYEPYELVHFSGNTYTTRTHDSLKISNGKWMWWSQGTGGRSALDYLIKVRGYSFLEAVELLAERANIQPPLSVSENVPMEKQLLLPKKNQDDQKVIAYLSGRGIDKEIIQFCLESGRVYESAFHHNVVFVGMNEKDNPKYAAIRGTGSSFIGEANGYHTLCLIFKMQIRYLSYLTVFCRAVENMMNYCRLYLFIRPCGKKKTL